MKQTENKRIERLAWYCQRAFLATAWISFGCFMTMPIDLPAQDNGFTVFSNPSVLSLAAATQSKNDGGNGAISSQDDAKLIDEYIKSIPGSVITFDAANIKQYWIDNTVYAQNGKINITLKNDAKTKEWKSAPLKIQLARVNHLQKCKLFVITEEKDIGFQVTDSASKKIADSSYEKDFVLNHIYSSTFYLKDTFAEYSFNITFSSKESQNISIKKVILSIEKAPELLVVQKPEIKVVSPVADAAANKARSEHIESEKNRIETVAASLDGQAEFYKKFSNEKVQKKFNDVLFSMDSSIKNFGKHLPKNNSAEGLIALNRFLLNNGIHLIVIVWPQPNEVAADLFYPELVKEGQYLDIARVELMKELLVNDVEVVDPFPALVKNRFQYPPLLFQAHLYDSLPASGASRIAGEEVANLLKRYNFPKNDTDKWTLAEIPMRSGRTYEDKKETAVMMNEKNNAFDNKSPILFVGDATCYHPQSQSSVTSFCSYFLQQRVGMYAGGSGGPGLFKYIMKGQQTSGILNQKKVLIASVYPAHLTSASIEIPVGYPDFSATTYTIQKSYSIYDAFEGVKAVWSVSGDPIDFSAGKIPPEEPIPARNKVKLILPDYENLSQNCFLRITTKVSGAFSLSFNESDSPEVISYGSNELDEFIIPVKTGKDMSITIPTNVSILDISYIKKVN